MPTETMLMMFLMRSSRGGLQNLSRHSGRVQVNVMTLGLETIQLVLVEGPNKRAPETELIGKSDRGLRVSFLNLPLPDRLGGINDEQNPTLLGILWKSTLQSRQKHHFWERHLL
ncbi:hypothetical protein SLEP1_g49062 [Rubroshorea leprosula]|uniref:Uncharacterized protein n=1 Tax=Rubroshorea leprosula TaxID=152421 RepID=A0AAV5LWT7_9ROSI|nr:hypothetical protein SLEP1_g49062 [Rubroshorea leprosula]